MGATEVQQFLIMLTTQRNVSVSTHNQTLSALLFLYCEVLGVLLPLLDDVKRPARLMRWAAWRDGSPLPLRSQPWRVSLNSNFLLARKRRSPAGDGLGWRPISAHLAV